MKKNIRFKIIIMIIGCFILSILNYLFDYFLRPDNMNVLRNISVAFGFSLGSGLVWIYLDRTNSADKKKE